MADPQLLRVLKAVYEYDNFVVDGDDPEEIFPGISRAIKRGLVLGSSRMSVGIEYSLTKTGLRELGIPQRSIWQSLRDRFLGDQIKY